MIKTKTSKIRIYPKSKKFLDQAESLKNYKTYPQKVDAVIKLSAHYIDDWLRQPAKKKKTKWEY